MTASDVAELSSNPGQILKTTREQLSYSLDRVAGELHLRASVVEAMEAEDYDSFSSIVFLKGYFRAYCRLLNLSEESLIELLEKQLAARQQQLDELAAHARKLKLLRARKKLAIVLVLSVIIATVSVLIVGDIYQTGNPDSSVEGQADADRQADVDTVENRLELGVEASADTQQEPVVEGAAAGLNDAELNGTELNSAGESEQISEQVESVEAPVTDESISDTQENQENVPSDTPDPATSEVQFQARFRGDCWFSLKDGNNKTIVADLKRAGDVVSYTGRPPLRIVLGNALLAELSLNGESIDVEQYAAKNGRAQFTLGKEL